MVRSEVMEKLFKSLKAHLEELAGMLSRLFGVVNGIQLWLKTKKASFKILWMLFWIGEMQNFKAKGGAYTRENFFAKDPSVLKIVEDLTDEDIYKLNRGGHDPYKVYAAYHKAVNSKGAPTVILALTTKGYGVGSREADNTTHQS